MDETQTGPTLNGQPGALRMCLQIARAATGKTETVELIGTLLPQPEEEQDVCDAQ